MGKDILSIINEHERICIQMHNNPDADALASAYAMQRFLRYFNKRSDILYYGSRIKKPNLKMFMEEYKIFPRNIIDTEIKDLDYTLNIMVDCQLGESNVKNLAIDSNIILDHHINNGFEYENVEFKLIREEVASCASIVYELFSKYTVPIDTKVGASLYYGLLTDTNKFTTPLSPLDRDMVDYLEESNLIEKFLINILIKENLNYEDLMIAQRAIMSYMRDDKYNNIAIVQVDSCEQNLLGYISDTLIEVSGVSLSIVYCKEDKNKYRLSVRSCDKFIKAQEIIEYLTRNIGAGGGNTEKSGGVIIKDIFYDTFPDDTLRSYIEKSVVRLWNKYEKLESGKNLLPKPLLEKTSKYYKMSTILRYIDLEELFGDKDKILIRTLEGDIVTKSKDTYAVIGIEGEIYPIDKLTFESKYFVEDHMFADCDESVKKKGYKPKLKSQVSGKEVFLSNLDSFPTCKTKPTQIEAVKLEKHIKVITKWSKSKPLNGRPGDYLVVSNPYDYYVINENIFKQTYTS